ncbi:MAG: hypothetical protein A2017_21225 [Lentisphaerae bacterium GWF2_44_16]|nr:MAG: hypothetical protein A2017_21225 [Lentisphaerae bacterium GWF2_44_16]
MNISDFLVRGIIKSINARFSFADTVSTVTKGIFVHDTDPVSSFIFAKALTVGALVSPLLEGDEKYSLRWEYDGKISSVLVDVNAKCEVRGIPRETKLASMVSKEDELFGNDGKVTAIKSVDGKILNSGCCKAALMDIAEDMAFFFSTSDQLETGISVIIDLNGDPQKPVKKACGFMLQAMPGCDLKAFDVCRNRMNSPEFTAVIKSSEMTEEKKLWSIIGALLGISVEDSPENKIKKEIFYEFSSSPDYVCSCSRKKMKQAVSVLKKEEIDDIFREEKEIRIKCEFCNKTYSFAENDFSIDGL